jgi:ubiquinone biosynthesis monooxygenase Coq7
MMGSSNPLDHFIIEFDKALRTVFASARSIRPNPADGIEESALSDGDKAHAAALMRVTGANCSSGGRYERRQSRP